MPSKYDTNPLDPDFPEKVKAAAAAEVTTQTLPQGTAETRHFPPNAHPEEQTRRFAGPTDFQQPFTGQNVPAAYGPTAFAAADESSTRKVERLGIPEHMVIAAPYIPWYIGFVAGILILLLVPRSEQKVRFHAAQGLAAHVGIFIVTTILGFLSLGTDIASVGSAIFTLVTSIMLVVFAIKAWRGRPVHIESVDGLTNWLEEKISPKLAGK
jgi:uncharacterized membrane protein